MARISSLGEDLFVAFIARAARPARPSTVLGIGDDAAVLSLPRGAHTLVTTDLLTEGVHFRSAYTPGFLLGRKALTVNLSDIAAMGGIPHSFVVSFGLPRDLPLAYAREIVRGLVDAARRSGTSLVGGDTCAARVLFISVALLGVIEPGGEIRRDGARPGEGLYVTGSLGAAAAGLRLLRRGLRLGQGGRAGRPRKARGAPHDRARARAAAQALRSHLDPAARLEAGRALGLSRLATSMIDLSDGLSQDLARLCRASGAGAVVEEAAVPLAPAAERLLGARAALRCALGGGEDYELLFTALRENEAGIGRLARRIRLPMARIGEIVPRAGGVQILGRDGRYRPLARVGYEHFPR
jgi:thiamine-monophosphate kinase